MFGRAALLCSCVAFAILAVACSSDQSTEATEAPELPTTVVPPTRVPTPVPTAPPPPTPEPTMPPRSPGPSQSSEDAARDGIAQVVAELPVELRVDARAEVEVADQRWVISRFPRDIQDHVDVQRFVDAGVDLSGGELLQFEDDRIVRAISMDGAPPTWVVAEDDIVLAGRVGDGGYPDSAIVRVDVSSGETLKMFVPFGYDRDWLVETSERWDIAAPTTREALLPLIQGAGQTAGDPTTHQQTVADFESDLAVAETFDPTTLPALSRSNSRCDMAGSTGGVLYDLGETCVYQPPNTRPRGRVTFVGEQSLPGSLVGVGRMSTSGPVYAAIVGNERASNSGEPQLRFVEVADPTVELATGIQGRGEGSVVGQVSFFEGGFVVTRGIDLTVRVSAFDEDAQPLVQFVSPTDRDLGYPPDPSVSSAVASFDGQRLAWVERDWPLNLERPGEPGPGVAIVVADFASGRELQRVEFEIGTVDYVQWMDYDGRWAVVSFFTVGETAAPVPILIDTASGLIYPLGIGHHAYITFERRLTDE